MTEIAKAWKQLTQKARSPPHLFKSCFARSSLVSRSALTSFFLATFFHTLLNRIKLSIPRIPSCQRCQLQKPFQNKPPIGTTSRLAVLDWAYRDEGSGWLQVPYNRSRICLPMLFQLGTCRDAEKLVQPVSWKCRGEVRMLAVAANGGRFSRKG